MKVKTKELSGAALDWAVAMCEEVSMLKPERGQVFVYSSAFGNKYSPTLDGGLAASIIERELICVDAGDGSFKGDKKWSAWVAKRAPVRLEDEITGPSFLIAAMRCYVASKLGAEVEIPKELK